MLLLWEKEPPKKNTKNKHTKNKHKNKHKKTPKIIGAGLRYIVILAQDDSSFLLDAIAAVRDELPSVSDKVLKSPLNKKGKIISQAVIVGFSAGGVMAHRVVFHQFTHLY